MSMLLQHWHAFYYVVHFGYLKKYQPEITGERSHHLLLVRITLGAATLRPTTLGATSLGRAVGVAKREIRDLLRVHVS